MRWGAALAAALALVLGLPVTAAAATRYVAKGGADAPGCTSSGAPCATINYAVGQANDGDTIQIGPGTFVETVATNKVLSFNGAGAGTLGGIPATTTVRGSVESFAGQPALSLPNGGSVSSLRAQGGTGQNEPATDGDPGGDAILFESAPAGDASLRLDQVVAVGGDGGMGKTSDPTEMGRAGGGVEMRNGIGAAALSATASEFTGGAGLGGGDAIAVDGPDASADIVNSKLQTVESLIGGAIVGFSGARLALDSVEIDAFRDGATIYEGSMTIRRSRILSAFPVNVTASSGTTSRGEVTDSLLISNQGAAAWAESYDAGSTSTLNIVGSTIVALFSGGAVRASREAESGPSTVTLRNSIARYPAPNPGAADLVADGGTIDAAFSSFTTRLEEDGGTATAPGSANNIAGDPLFVDPGKGDFVLQGSSPLIDRGNPALTGAGQLDLAGSPRSLDGNRDCVATPDIGAFEVTGQGIACDTPPAISKFGISNKVFAPKGKKAKRAKSSASGKKVKRGTKFTYTLSEAAQVKITIERRKKTKKGKKAKFAKVTTLSGQKDQGRQSTSFSGRVKGKALKPGKYRATITATDSAGQASAPQQLSFKIVAG
jgi:hypothetical protein